MKLIGTYTSPFVRKIFVILLEKGIPFEFVNHIDSNGEDVVSRYSPLGTVPVLVMDNGEIWFDSPVIASVLEQHTPQPAILPASGENALFPRQVEALADGMLHTAMALVQALPPAEAKTQTHIELKARIDSALDWLEARTAAGEITASPLNLGAIAVGCAMGYLKGERIAQGWCATRPALVKLLDQLYQRESFARTDTPAP